LTSYLPGRADAPSQRLLQPQIEPALIPSASTLAEALKQSGYATGIFGKWHLGGGDSAATAQGFDVSIEPPGNGDPLTTGGKNENLITEKAIEFIQANRDKPFFCYVPHHSPHIMLNEQPSKIERNAQAWNPLYAAVIESLDDSIGKLLTAIEQSGQASNTIVIFSSDNGGLHVPEGHPTPATYNGPHRAGKGYLYEGGLRIPLIVRWPGKITQGRTIDAPVSLLDILPTILDAARIEAGKAASMKSNPSTRFQEPIGRREWIISSILASGMVASMHQLLVGWKSSIAAQECVPNPRIQPELHAELYLEQNASLIDGRTQTAKQIAESWAPWRSGMNKAIEKQQTKLKKTPSGITLLARDSLPHGKRIRFEPETYKNVVGYWTEVDDWVEWSMQIPKEGTYRVELHCGCGSGNGGSMVDVQIDSPKPESTEILTQTLEWKVRETGHFQNIIIEPIGVLKLQAGAGKLRVKLKTKAAAAVADIREIHLIPVNE